MALAQPKISYEDRLEIFDELCDLLRGRSVLKVSELSGVHFTTIHKWLRYETMVPRLDTMLKVANAIGYTLKLVKDNKKTGSRLKVVK